MVERSVRAGAVIGMPADEDHLLDPVRRVVTNQGAVVPLTRKEFELLHLLASNPGRVFSRDQLVELVWGYVWAGDTSTVTVHIRRLRSKIELRPATEGACFVIFFPMAEDTLPLQHSAAVRSES